MFRDIARERARLGGDWAIAGVILTSSMRQIARFSSSSINSSHQKLYLEDLNCHVILRRELGEDLEIIMLEMAVEEQEERVRTRHEGSQHAVDIMRVGFNIFN